MSKRTPEWKRFEQAVARFAAALDPSALVKHDVQLPDRHHGRRRQRDVWIEAKIGGHFPVSVLISCKRTKRRLTSADLDAFWGELASSSARVGVIYSYSGFTKGAIEKGRALDIPCCRLYSGEGSDIPAVLSFTSLCCLPRINVTLAEAPPDGRLSTWADLLAEPLEGSDREQSILDFIVENYCRFELQSVSAVDAGRRFPTSFGFEFVVRESSAAPAYRLVVSGSWRYYRARSDAYHIDGSYEFTRGDFKGSLATPAIDRFSSEPGPGWERIEAPPTISGFVALLVLSGGNVREALSEHLGPKKLRAANSALQPTGASQLMAAGG